MIPDSGSSVVTTTKSSITSALNDCGYYSTYSSSVNTPSYLTSNSNIIRSHSSKNANLFSHSNLKSYNLSDTPKLNSKHSSYFDYSLYSRPLINDKYFKSSSYDTIKKKSLQISSPSTFNKFQTISNRASSLPTNSYLSKTIDSKALDGNANYRVTEGIDSFPRLSSLKTDTVTVNRKYNSSPSKLYLNDRITNNYCNNKNSDIDKKNFTPSTYRRKYESKLSVDDSSNINGEGPNKWSGLQNIGNTCYMNSILQCLNSTKLLKEYCINKAYIKDISLDGKLVTAFSNLLSKLWSPTSHTVDVSSFKDVFQRLAPQFAGYDQHDAQEFLRFLVDKLHAEVNRVTSKPKHLQEINDKLSDNSLALEHWKRYLMCENSYILDLFAGQLKSTLQCSVCGHKSVTFEIFWDLSLPLPAYSSDSNNVTLSDILHSFTQKEILDGREKPKCACCKIEQRMTKSYSFQKLPKYLVLHLKRFQTSTSYRKLNTLVEFPLMSLDMSPFFAKSVIGGSRTYNLYAVSNHNGTPFSGHYTANCKHPSNGLWFSCNDSVVSKISQPVTKKIVNADAYILFYEAAE